MSQRWLERTDTLHRWDDTEDTAGMCLSGLLGVSTDMWIRMMLVSINWLIWLVNVAGEKLIKTQPVLTFVDILFCLIESETSTEVRIGCFDELLMWSDGMQWCKWCVCETEVGHRSGPGERRLWTSQPRWERLLLVFVQGQPQCPRELTRLLIDDLQLLSATNISTFSSSCLVIVLLVNTWNVSSSQGQDRMWSGAHLWGGSSLVSWSCDNMHYVIFSSSLYIA